MRTGDFNKDGLMDMAVANANDNTVSILLGNGDGTFAPATNSPVAVGGFPFFLAVADFNNDGSQDLAVGNQADSTVSILLGNGDGTFTQAAGSPVAGFNYNPGELVAADFNGDGRVDLAATNFTAVAPSTVGSVTVILGNGDGTFAAAPGSPIAVGVDPFAMAAGDFNEDGITDLAVVNYGLISNAPTQTLTLLLGNGDGSFTSAGTPTQLGDSPNELAVADFNGDGTPDLAICNIADFDTTILLDHLTQTETASVAGITIAGSGTHYVDAVYPGNTYFAPSTSNTVPLQGLIAPSTLTLTASTLNQLYSLPVTLTAQVATAENPPPPQGPTGTVSFYDNGALMGTAAVNAAGQAIYITTSLGGWSAEHYGELQRRPELHVKHGWPHHRHYQRPADRAQREREHHYFARHHRGLHPAGDARGDQHIPLQRDLYHHRAAAGGKRYFLSGKPGRRERRGYCHHDGDNRQDRAERTTARAV